MHHNSNSASYKINTPVSVSGRGVAAAGCGLPWPRAWGRDSAPEAWLRPGGPRAQQGDSLECPLSWICDFITNIERETNNQAYSEHILQL